MQRHCFAAEGDQLFIVQMFTFQISMFLYDRTLETDEKMAHTRKTNAESSFMQMCRGTDEDE